MIPNVEFNFSLPKGLIDDRGEVHRQGVMRLATAKDEIAVDRDRRVQDNPAYGLLVRLSRTIVKLGKIVEISPEVLENLFTLDLAYLQEFYNRINQQGNPHILTQCPQCHCEFPVSLARSGELQATP
jgi:hypothetical protein